MRATRVEKTRQRVRAEGESDGEGEEEIKGGEK